MVRRKPYYFVGECLGYFMSLCPVYQFENAFYTNRWKISFIKTQRYAFADLFNSHLNHHMCTALARLDYKSCTRYEIGNE